MNILKIKNWIPLVMVIIISCSKDESDTSTNNDTGTIKSVEEDTDTNAILSFIFETGVNRSIDTEVVATIDQEERTILAIVPFNTDVSALVPSIIISDAATIDKRGFQDFTNSVIYSVTAEDGSTSSYTVTVIVAALQQTSSFVSTWKTTSPNESITIYVNPSITGYNYQIDWGDGTVEINRSGDAIHEYSIPRNYTVQISMDFPAIFSPSTDTENANKLQSIENWGSITWQSMDFAFRNCINLTYNASDIPNLENVTSMRGMFIDTRNFNGNINDWDVSNVENMSFMFSGASNFNQDLNNWDVGNVTNMSQMFSQAFGFNGNISGWDVGNVENMSFMFSFASNFNGSLNKWNVSKVEDMSGMFSLASNFNVDLNAWDVSSVQNMREMFDDARNFNGTIDNWNVSAVTNMSSMFNSASNFNQNLSGWETNNVTICDDFHLNSALETAYLPTVGSCFSTK